MGETNVVKANSEIFLSSLIQKIARKDDGDLYIYGLGSAEVLDSQNEIVKMKALEKSLPQLLARKSISFEHRDTIVGTILEEQDIDGRIIKTKVDYPNDFDIIFFKSLNISLDPLQKYLFILGQIFSDNEFNNSLIQKISEGVYGMFSIAGHKLDSAYVCDKKKCFTNVEDLTLDAVTITKKGANPLAKFKPIKNGGNKMDENPEIKEEKKIEKSATVETPEINKYEILEKKYKEAEEKLAALETKIAEKPKEEKSVEPVVNSKEGYQVRLTKEDIAAIAKESSDIVLEVLAKKEEAKIPQIKEEEEKKKIIQKTKDPERLEKSEEEDIVEKLNIISKIRGVRVI